MKRIRDPIFALIIYIAGLLVISFLFFIYIKENDKNVLNYISYAGTYSTIIGIFLAYFQILSIKETSEKTKEKVDQTNQRTFKILSISDLSKSIKLVQEIQNYLLSDKIESAILRSKDLKSILIQLKYNNQLKALTETKEYQESLNDTSINITNLNQQLLKIKPAANIGKIISDLEKIENQLGEFEGHLKFTQND